jgi:hypothetical protein
VDRYVLGVFTIDAGNAAGWVQAIGTIVAIWFAYAAGSRQHKIDVQRELIRDARQVIATLEPVQDLLAEIARIGNDVVKIYADSVRGRAMSLHPEYGYLSSCGKALNDIVVHSMPGTRVAVYLARAQSCWPAFFSICNTQSSDAILGKQFGNDLIEHLAAYKAALGLTSTIVGMEKHQVKMAKAEIDSYASWRAFVPFARKVPKVE